MRTISRLCQTFLVMTLALGSLPGISFADDNDRTASACTPETDKYRNGEINAFVNEMEDADYGWYVEWNCTGSSCSEYKYNEEDEPNVDTSDLHYHCGHGGKKQDDGCGGERTAMIFSDDSYMLPSEARLNGYGIWGDTDLEWMAIKTCELLDDEDESYVCWRDSMNGLHLLLSFETNSQSSSGGYFSRTFAQKLKDSATLTQAWFDATDASQESGTVCRVIAEDTEQFEDHLDGYGSVSNDHPHDSDWYCWDHEAGSPPYLVVDPPLTEMREYKVASRTVDYSYVGTIASAFGLGSEPIIDDGDRFLIATGAPDYSQVEVDKSSGIYSYICTSKLWDQTYELSGPPYSPSLAYQAAEAFYTSNPFLYRVTQNAYEVMVDSVTKVVNGAINWQQTAATAVVYTRAVFGDAGGQVPVSVAGPGARTKLYLDRNGTPMGARGNWRAVWWDGSTMVPVADKLTAWNSFVVHGSNVTVSSIDVEYDSVSTDVGTATQGYYELAAGTAQAKLIPVWIFKVDYYEDGDLVLDDAYTFVYMVTYSPSIPMLTRWGMIVLMLMLLAAGMAILVRGRGLVVEDRPRDARG